RTRTRCVSARRADGVWHLALENGVVATARVLVNAAGPHVTGVLHDVVGEPRLYEHDRSYIFQNADGRICFAIPYQQDFTLIGTTDEDYHGDPWAVSSSSDEERYLCGAVSEYLRAPV